jgi:hypothetical protein
LRVREGGRVSEVEVINIKMRVRLLNIQKFEGERGGGN